ncbi:MAG: hypothetical protein M1821_009260 [Bathelium mastoideum]|nr:MAG: hypothetical protein M1821_009260 [Bathelium mastoideum]
MSAQQSPIDVAEARNLIPNAAPGRVWDDRWQQDKQRQLVKKFDASKPWRFNEQDLGSYLGCGNEACKAFVSLINDAFERANPDGLPWREISSYRVKMAQFKYFGAPVLQAWSTQFNIPAHNLSPWEPNRRLHRIAYEVYKRNCVRSSYKQSTLDEASGELGSTTASKKARQSGTTETQTESTKRKAGGNQSIVQSSNRPVKKSRLTAPTTSASNALIRTSDPSSANLVQDERHKQLIHTLKGRSSPPRIPKFKHMIYQLFFTDIEPYIPSADIYEAAKTQVIPLTTILRPRSPSSSLDIGKLQQKIEAMSDMHYDKLCHKICLFGRNYNGFECIEIVTDDQLTSWSRIFHSWDTFPIVIIVCRRNVEGPSGVSNRHSTALGQQNDERSEEIDAASSDQNEELSEEMDVDLDNGPLQSSIGSSKDRAKDGQPSAVPPVRNLQKMTARAVQKAPKQSKKSATVVMELE